MTTIRKPAVAGRFYPGDAQELRRAVRNYLDSARLEPAWENSGEKDRSNAPVKAIIVPHAGYVYSGPISGTGYAQLKQRAGEVSRVILLGPAHFYPVQGLAACRADFWETPLGSVPIDTRAINELLALGLISIVDAAHLREHSLEVHVPFLQETLGEFRLIPLVVGEATPEAVAQVVEQLWDGPETVFVVSSDLSHFHDYETAHQLDQETSRKIVGLEFEKLRGERACGFRAIAGLLKVARERGLAVRLLDQRNSGDTAGARDRVVGYGAYAIG